MDVSISDVNCVDVQLITLRRYAGDKARIELTYCKSEIRKVLMVCGPDSSEPNANEITDRLQVQEEEGCAP